MKNKFVIFVMVCFLLGCEEKETFKPAGSPSNTDSIKLGIPPGGTLIGTVSFSSSKKFNADEYNQIWTTYELNGRTYMVHCSSQSRGWYSYDTIEINKHD